MKTIFEYLNTPCKPEDLIQLSEGIYYMPAPVVHSKIKFMEQEFGAKFLYSNFQHFFHNTPDGKIIASGSLNLKIIDNRAFGLADLIGCSSFFTETYMPNYHFAATLKTLCRTNALGSEYPQFGSLILNEQEKANFVEEPSKFQTTFSRLEEELKNKK